MAVAYIKEKVNVFTGRKWITKTYGKVFTKKIPKIFYSYVRKFFFQSWNGTGPSWEINKKRWLRAYLSFTFLWYKRYFSLALRLAMAEYFLQDKSGFLILDDPLVDMDAGRQALAAEQINEFAKTKQVIFLTCHPQTAKMLKGEMY